MGRRVVAPAWEPIPDDVHVLRRRPRRDRVVADDVEVFGRFVKRGRRRTISPPTSAEPPRPTAAPPSDVPRQLVTRDPSPRMDASETRAVSSPAAPFSSVDPVPYSALTALDPGMMRNLKANRKRARDAQTLLKRAAKLKDVKFFNRLVKDFGNDKQLGFAEEAFARCVANCAPNAYTHTNRINACVRVGELEKARGAWNDMVAAGVEPNEVTHTVMIKGLAQEGLLDEATARLRRMCEDAERAGESAAARPNARTFAALLRGCVRHADPTNADVCFALMRETGVAPDATAFEYLVKTRCAAMDAEGAWAAFEEMERETLLASAQTCAALAFAMSLAGETAKAKQACAEARQAIERNGESGEGGSGKGGGFGGRESNEDVEEDAGGDLDRRAAPSDSVRKFLALRDGDATRQVEEVEAFLARGEKHVADVAAVVRAGPESADTPVRVFEQPDRKERADGLRLDFATLFSRRGDDARETRLEVCSGHGDWVTARADADRDRSDWLAIEMRRNRVRMTWAKAVRLRLSNLALLRGMAHETMRDRIPDATLAEIHVNYPDPPEWVGSSQCLVDEAFLLEAHRCLRAKHGHLTLVTDDPTYAMRMCRELSRMPSLFQTTEPDGKPFRTGVPEGYGGSYFDDMWTNGNLRDRYYIRYEAVK